MHRRLAALAVLAALVVPATALAAGPTYVSAGGLGVAAPDGKTRYVALPTSKQTAIARVRVADGSIESWAELDGTWGIPAPTFSPTGGEGLFRNGKRLVVGTFGAGSPSRFAIINTRTMRVVESFSLDGSFAYDALSPDGSTLYLVQHVDAENVNRYVVRAYDLRTHQLAPGRIADKSQLGWVMEGSALTRATSSDGRWVYTLYGRPGGYPFIHSLDTVNGSAHCTGLPWHGDQAALTRVRLTVSGDGDAVAVSRQNGKPWLTLSTTSWRLTQIRSAEQPLPWLGIGAGAGGALALTLVALALLKRRVARDRREAVPLAL